MARFTVRSLGVGLVLASLIGSSQPALAGNPIPRFPCAVYLQGYLHLLSQPSKSNEGSTVDIGGATWNFAKQRFMLNNQPVAEIVPLVKQVPPAAGKTCSPLTNLDRKISGVSVSPGGSTIPQSGAFSISYGSNGLGERLSFVASTKRAPTSAPSTPSPTPPATPTNPSPTAPTEPREPIVINQPNRIPTFPSTPPIKKVPATTKLSGQVVAAQQTNPADTSVSLLSGIPTEQLEKYVGTGVTAFIDRMYTDPSKVAVSVRQLFPTSDQAITKEWADPSLCPPGMTLVACIPPLAGNLRSVRGTLSRSVDGLPTLPTSALKTCAGRQKQCISLFSNVLVDNALKEIAANKQYPAPYYILSESSGLAKQSIYQLTWLKPSEEATVATTTATGGAFTFSDVPVTATHLRATSQNQSVELYVLPTPVHPASGLKLALTNAAAPTQDTATTSTPQVATTTPKPFKTEGGYTSAALTVPTAAKPSRIAVVGLKQPEGTSVEVEVAVDGKLDTFYPAPAVPTVCVAEQVASDICADKTLFDLSDATFSQAKTLTVRFTLKGTTTATPSLKGFSIWYAPTATTTPNRPATNPTVLGFTLDRKTVDGSLPEYEAGGKVGYILSNPLANPVSVNLSCGLQASVYEVVTDTTSQKSSEQLVSAPVNCVRAIGTRSFGRAKLELAPGESVTGSWNQTANVNKKIIQPGTYRLRVTTGNGDVTADFKIIAKPR